MASNAFVIEPITPTKSISERAHDPEDAMNGPRHHTGLPCVERNCYEPAGTAWGPYRCQRHNAEQLDRFSLALAELGSLVGA